MYGLPRNINEKSLKASTQVFKYHIYKLRTRHFREYLLAKKERITPLIKTLISIIIWLSIDIDLLHETNTYVSKNANGIVKYSSSNLHQNLSTKCSDDKNVNCDSFHLPMETMDKKVGNREIEYQFTVTDNVKVMTGSIYKKWFLSVCTDLDLLLFFWWCFLSNTSAYLYFWQIL